jgi:hypothetical protein
MTSEIIPFKGTRLQGRSPYSGRNVTELKRT